MSFKRALKSRFKPMASWALQRLSLMRDAEAVKTYDFGPTDIQAVKDLMAGYASTEREIRAINWLVPSVKHPLFAGVHTVLRFADYFSRKKGIQNRIFFYGSQARAVSALKEKVGKKFPALADSVYGLADSDPEKLPESDIGIATYWPSAYLLLRARGTAAKFYFVQDFEPSFYPAGSVYGLVEATYRMGYWGIANTPGLGDFLRDSYAMTVKSFQPAVDSKMFCPGPTRPAAPIKIFFYGRPGNPRNGFVLGIEALKQVKKRFGSRVEIVSAGGAWSPSDFGAKGVVENLGLLPTIEDVAALYRTCHIGLVFMFTRHPSYQPIEMMASGVAVVANENSALRSLLKSENSLIAEPTITSVAEAISLLVSDANLRNTLASEGLKASQQFSWNAEIERVYEFIAGRPNAQDMMPFAAGEQAVSRK